MIDQGDYITEKTISENGCGYVLQFLNCGSINGTLLKSWDNKNHIVTTS